MTRKFGLTAGLAMAALALAAPVPASAAQAQKRFGDAGEHAFRVPRGVTVIHIVTVGGRGEDFQNEAGGKADSVEGNLSVSPGRVVYATVGYGGGAGGVGDVPSYAGGDGGGASDLRLCSEAVSYCPFATDSLHSRVLVAAGGGGAAFGVDGGAAGLTGNPSQLGRSFDAYGGTAGTLTTGGTGGNPTSEVRAYGLQGRFGSGGRGGSATDAFSGGGGGGGGYYGGGGGGGTGPTHYAGSGGGGSSYAGGVGSPQIAQSAATEPSVTISWDDTTGPDLRIDDPAAGTRIAGGTISGVGGTDVNDSDAISVVFTHVASEAIFSLRATVDRSTGRWSVQVPDGLGQGEFTVSAGQTDSVGNQGLAHETFTRDSQSPELTIDSPMSGAQLANRAVSVRGTAPTAMAGDLPQVDVAVYRGGDTSSMPVAEYHGEPRGDWQLDAALEDGDYTAVARQSDDLGNVTSVERRFNVKVPVAQQQPPTDPQPREDPQRQGPEQQSHGDQGGGDQGGAGQPQPAPGSSAQLNRVCVVPTLKGLSLKSAKRKLAAAGCKVKVKRARSARVRRGRVIKASAKAGAKLAAGSVVTLKVSRGRG